MGSVRASAAAQGMRLKRFALAVVTYLVMLALGWWAVLHADVRVSQELFGLLTVAVLLSQVAFALLYRCQVNLRFRDPGMTLAQILCGLLWMTLLLASVEHMRGTLLLGYVVVLLFGITRLAPRTFAYCALFGFACFVSLGLLEWAFQPVSQFDPIFVLQLGMLAVALLWLCLFSSHVQSMRRRMRARSIALQAHQQTLRGMMGQLEELVATDELTGLFNRRHFMRMAEKEGRRLRGGRSHGLALIDLDHFKRVNDLYGHASGDQVLQVFAEVARNCLRESDVLARYGGEEFVLLIPEADQQQLAQCCERLRAAYAATVIPQLQGATVSLSIGMTLLRMNDDLEVALNLADQALYRAKRQGRNRCCASWDKEGDGQASSGQSDDRSLVRQ